MVADGRSQPVTRSTSSEKAPRLPGAVASLTSWHRACPKRSSLATRGHPRVARRAHTPHSVRPFRLATGAGSAHRDTTYSSGPARRSRLQPAGDSNALHITVKVTLHRARKAVGSAHQTPFRNESTPVITALLQALATGHVPGMVALLHPQATFDSDSNGTVTAAGVPISQRSTIQRLDLTPLGSLPVLAMSSTSTIPRWPTRSVLLLDSKEDVIHRLWSQLNTAKLS
jgi:hypothetical protein